MTKLDYHNPTFDRKRKPISVLRVLGWICGGIVVAGCVVALLLPSQGRARESANRVKCASNLRIIGQAILLYANDNRGRLPPDFAAILATQDITSEVFVCPSRSYERAKGATTQQVTAEMLSGDHLSYVYVGGSNSSLLISDNVIAFDLEQHIPKDSAKGTGINVLLGDCSVEFVDERVSKAIWARFIAGIRPIRLSECDPTAQSTTPATLPKS
jgi:hypothetical protein